jgi:hypothetical protein
MGMALKDNFFGHLDTLEYLPENQAQAEIRMKIMGLTDYVTCHLIDAAEFNPDKTYQVILLDTEPELRFGEFVKYYQKLDEGGYMFIHDLGRHLQQIEIPNLGFAWPFGKLPEEMKQLMKDGKIRPFHFTTPRGFSGFYKVSREDYSWL